MKYQKQESTTLEFKRELPAKQQIIKTIIGFCNMYGGHLIIGVGDDCEIVGVDENHIEELIEEINRSIYASCTPTIIPSLHTERIDDKLLLVIEVSEGMTKPYFISVLGKQEGTYIRIGTQTVKATAQMLQELDWQSLGNYPDELPVYSAHLDDIDQIEFKAFLSSRKVKEIDPNIEELLFHYNIVRKEHNRVYASRGGLLLFGKEPQKQLSEAFIICTHFLGNAGREVVATRDCMGSLFQQYKECMSFLLTQLNRRFTIEGANRREETLEVPEEALREVVINALVHRSYSIPGPTKIAIYGDRIEVFSPGNFPGPIQIQQLTMGITYIRNIIISRTFREIGLMEKLGSGFQTLFRCYEEAGLPRPTICEGGGFVKCILPRPVVGTILRPYEDPLLKLFGNIREVKIVDVMKTLAVSRATASRRLQALQSQGLITRIGQGPSTRYISTEAATRL